MCFSSQGTYIHDPPNITYIYLYIKFINILIRHYTQVLRRQRPMGGI